MTNTDITIYDEFNFCHYKTSKKKTAHTMLIALLRTKSTSALLLVLHLSQIGHSHQYLEGPITTWRTTTGILTQCHSNDKVNFETY